MIFRHGYIHTYYRPETCVWRNIHHARAILQHLRFDGDSWGAYIKWGRGRGAPALAKQRPLSPVPTDCYKLCTVSCDLCFVSSKMSATKWFVCAVVTVYISIRQISAAPAPPQEEYPPMPYEYKYDVEDPEKALYFGANEAGDAQGKVIGGYRVLLPDGRLMNVEYTVEGDSGFVPKISFESNSNPFGKGK